MQRFGLTRRPIWAALLAFCSVGLAIVPVKPTLLFGQDRLQPGGATQPADAATSTDPVLVLTVASLNKLIQDVNYLSGVMGQPQAGGMFTIMAGTFTEGLDTSRPIGVLVPMVDGSPEPIGVLPTADVELMLKRLEAQTGAADKLDDGTFVVAAGTSLVYIRQVGEWAVIARNRELIDLVPADPTTLMEGLGDNYDLGLRLNIQEIPIALRELLVDQLSQGFEQAMARQEGGDDQVAELSKGQLEQINKLIREADQLMFGLNINPIKRVINIDTEFTAAPGTSLARMYAGQSAIPSKFSAVLKGDPALRYHAAASVSPEVIEASEASMESVLASLRKALDDQDSIGDDVKVEVEELLAGLVDLTKKTMLEGKFDIGMMAMAGDNMLRVVGGAFVHDGDEVAAWVKKLADKLSQIPDAPEFRFDESTYSDVTMHSVVIDIPGNQAEARRLFGPKAIVRLGTAPQAVYFALGEGSEEAMKRLIDSAGSDSGEVADRPLGQMRIKLLPVLRFAQSVKANDSVAAVIDSVALGGDNDYFSITATAIDNGQASNVEIGEGIIKALGAVLREVQNAQMQQMQRGGGQF